MNDLYADILTLSHLIDSNAAVLMQDIADDMAYFRKDVSRPRTKTIEDYKKPPLISFNLDRIESVSRYYAKSRLIYNLRITFSRGTLNELKKDNLEEIQKVTNFIHALSLKGYVPSSVQVVKGNTALVVIYICTLSKEIKSSVC